jgi:hypothetical protein
MRSASKAKEKEGGKTAQLTGSLGETLALNYLRLLHPGTMIRLNPYGASTNGYDIEQVPDYSWTGMPDRVWEVKTIKQSSRSFLVNPKAHRKLLSQRTYVGRSYVFIVLIGLNHSVNRSRGELNCEYILSEISAQQVGSSLLRKAKMYCGQKKIPYSHIFTKE